MSLHSCASFLDALPPFFDSNNLELCNIDKDNEENYYDEDCPSKRVSGRCIEGYALGNLFDSCWYTKFLAPNRDGIESSRSHTWQMSGRQPRWLLCYLQTPLDKVEYLATMIIEKQIIVPTRRIKNHQYCNSSAGCR